MSEEFYKDLRNPSKSYHDRYKNCILLEDKESGEILLSSRDINEIPVSANDKYHRVQSNETTRLDMIAHKYYKNPLLWWVIAQANGITDPFEILETGILLRIPAIESLYGNNGILL